MIAQVENGGRRGLNPWRAGGWSIAAGLLLLPLIGMQFSEEVNWTGGDFIFAALLIGVVGLGLELAVRVSNNWAYRAAVGCALGASFMIVWATGAVGMIGSEGNPYNLFFFGVIGMAILGAVIVRFRPSGMAVAMAVAAAAHIAVAVIGMSADLRGGILSALLAGPWLLSAALFRQAAQDQAAAGSAG